MSASMKFIIAGFCLLATAYNIRGKFKNSLDHNANKCTCRKCIHKHSQYFCCVNIHNEYHLDLLMCNYIRLNKVASSNAFWVFLNQKLRCSSDRTHRMKCFTLHFVYMLYLLFSFWQTFNDFLVVFI